MLTMLTMFGNEWGTVWGTSRTSTSFAPGGRRSVWGGLRSPRRFRLDQRRLSRRRTDDRSGYVLNDALGANTAVLSLDVNRDSGQLERSPSTSCRKAREGSPIDSPLLVWTLDRGSSSQSTQDRRRP